jgi:hypothetical protein
VPPISRNGRGCTAEWDSSALTHCVQKRRRTRGRGRCCSSPWPAAAAAAAACAAAALMASLRADVAPFGRWGCAATAGNAVPSAAAGRRGKDRGHTVFLTCGRLQVRRWMLGWTATYAVSGEVRGARCGSRLMPCFVPRGFFINISQTRRTRSGGSTSPSASPISSDNSQRAVFFRWRLRWAWGVFSWPSA